jgi:hypothetical protein
LYGFDNIFLEWKYCKLILKLKESLFQLFHVKIIWKLFQWAGTLTGTVLLCSFCDIVSASKSVCTFNDRSNNYVCCGTKIKVVFAGCDCWFIRKPSLWNESPEGKCRNARTFIHTYVHTCSHMHIHIWVLCAHKTIKLLSTMQQNMNIVKWKWVKGTVKVRLSQCLSIRARWQLGVGGCCWSVSPHILCILNLDSIWRWEVSYMPQLLGPVWIQ